MAARVVAQHLVALRQALRFLVPHLQIAGEGMAQGEPGAFALDGVVDVDTVGVDFHAQASKISLRNEGISPEGTFPSRGIETFGAPPIMIPWIGPLRNSFCNGFQESCSAPHARDADDLGYMAQAAHDAREVHARSEEH